MQQTHEQTTSSATTEMEGTTGAEGGDAVLVSDAGLTGLYDWFRELFSSEGDASSDTAVDQAAGQIDALIGTATVLRNDEQSPLRLGDDIFAHDTIATGTSSKITIVFSDGMEFRLGPDAKVLIDDFVFDQAASTGLQSLSAIKGAFAYQSGLIAESDPSAVTIKTPLGTLGIRGTKLMGLADTPEGQCVITLLEGRVEVSGDKGGSAVLSEKFDTAKMQIDWTHVDKSPFSRSDTESAFKDLLFDGDEGAMKSFIGEGGSSRLDEGYLYSIHGDAGATDIVTHIEG